MNKKETLERLNEQLTAVQSMNDSRLIVMDTETRLINTILRLEEAIALDKRMEYLADSINGTKWLGP